MTVSRWCRRRRPARPIPSPSGSCRTRRSEMKSVVTMMKTAVLLLALALVAAGSGWAQSEEQPSLGDAARKQREKRAQEEQKGKKVLTNEDLPAGAVSSGSQSSSGAASSSEGQAGAESQDAAKPG